MSERLRPEQSSTPRTPKYSASYLALARLVGREEEEEGSANLQPLDSSQLSVPDPMMTPSPSTGGSQLARQEPSNRDFWSSSANYPKL